MAGPILSEVDRVSFQQRMRADPRVRELWLAKGGGKAVLTDQDLRPLGYGVPVGSTFQIDADPGTGSLTSGRTGHDVLKGMILPTAIAGGGIALSALAPAGAATAPSAATGGGGAGTAAAGTAGATTGTGAITTATGGTAASLGSQLLRYGLPIAGSVANSLIQSSAAKAAAQAEQDAYNKALAAAEEQKAYDRAQAELARQREAEQTAYDRARYAEAQNYARNNYANYVTTLNPYLRAGTSATSTLAQLLGQQPITIESPDYNTLAASGRTPVNLPELPNNAPAYGGYTSTPTSPSAGSASQGVSTNLVPMVAPNGEQSLVPADQVAHYESLGARRAG